jgi:DNA repair exonuclease SbcCD ATPase subunit
MPPGPHRRQTLSDFCLKGLAEASEYLVRTISNELSLQRTIAEEGLHKLQSELKEQKEESRARIDFFESKLRSLETDRAESMAKEQSLREALNQMSRERERLEQELNERLEALRKDSARQIEEARNKISAQEEQQKEIQRTRLAAESEFDKQKALLEQKLEYLERSLEESQRKEKELSVEVKNQKRDQSAAFKEMQARMEQHIKDLGKKVEE